MNIDTLSIARELRATELPAEQAEAIAAPIGRAVSESSGTKADLELVKAGLEAKIEQIEAELGTGLEPVRTELERTRNQIMLCAISSQIALAGIIIAVIRL